MMLSTTLHHEPPDHEGGKLGMWLFLFTELFFFGGLFLVYAVFRSQHSESFHTAADELNAFIGTLNTVVLLISSMTIAMSLTALRKGETNRALLLIATTIVLAILFMVNKYFEWSDKIEYLVYPGSEVVKNMEQGKTLFYGLYYGLTGLHALHVIIGIVLLTIVLVKVKTGGVGADKYLLLENSALYWHLVDLIWIFLFPLLYLVS